MLSLLSLEHKQKNLQIHFEVPYFSFFLLYSFGMETINFSYIQSRSSLKTHPLFSYRLVINTSIYPIKGKDKIQNLNQNKI